MRAINCSRVAASDPGAYILAASVLMVAAIGAALAPAIVVARLDPVVALNDD